MQNICEMRGIDIKYSSKMYSFLQQIGLRPYMYIYMQDLSYDTQLEGKAPTGFNL